MLNYRFFKIELFDWVLSNRETLKRERGVRIPLGPGFKVAYYWTWTGGKLCQLFSNRILIRSRPGGKDSDPFFTILVT